ncbi:hypothetical protein D3C77_527540 [compost metagenome]
MLLDVAPGGNPVTEELHLTSGRPLVRWACRGGLEEAHRWLEEGRDRNAFIDLEISLTEAMSMSEIQALRKAHEGIVHIRPIYPGRDEEQAIAARAQMPVHELFRKFYQRQSSGAEPEEELVELFMSLVADEEAAVQEEEEEL